MIWDGSSAMPARYLFRLKSCAAFAVTDTCRPRLGQLVINLRETASYGILFPNSLSLWRYTFSVVNMTGPGVNCICEGIGV